MNKVLLIPVFFLLAFLFAIYFLLPAYGEVKDFRQEVSDKKAELQTFKNYVASINELKEVLKGQGESLEKIESALPDEFSLAEIFNFFQAKAEESGLIVKALNKSDSKKQAGEEPVLENAPQAGVKENYFAADLEGSVFALENFLSSLEKSSRMIEVEEMTIKSGENEQFSFYLLCKAYSY